MNMLEHPDQKDWPNERVGGWAPGNYTPKCIKCGRFYFGDKRSFHCYPCAKSEVDKYISITSECVDNDPVTVEFIGVDWYNTDRTIHDAVDNGMGKKELIIFLLKQRNQLFNEYVSLKLGASGPLTA